MRLKILLISTLLVHGAATARDLEDVGSWRYGPNLRHGALLETPIVWGTGVPRAQHAFRFDWLEPLSEGRYGTPLALEPLFLRLQATSELSPFFGRGTLGLGMQMVPRVEVQFVYGNMVYFGSNVEMAMVGRTEESDIAETWRSGYIMEQLYQRSAFDQIQTFQFSFDIDLAGSHHDGGIEAHYSLLDVRTDFDGKNYDYSSGLPVYSRDFLFESCIWGLVPVARGLSVTGELSHQTTGYIKDIIGQYTKDPQTLFKVMGGPVWNMGSRNPWRFAFMPGWWSRGRADFNGEFSEQFLIQVQFQQEWNLFSPAR